MTRETILLADDDGSIRTVLERALGREGYRVQATGEAATLWKWVSAGDGDLVITDVVMPDESGFDLLPRIKQNRPDLPVVVMSAQNTILTAITATERGAYEYLSKPFDLGELSAVVRRALRPTKKVLADDTISDPSVDGETLPLIGRSQPMQEIYRVLARLMPTDLTVMISGESGTGKELVARALHDYGKRRHGPFIAINMAAIPRELIESELFEHEKGAFTGATATSMGRFAQANGGTLFLDEIGDMPAEAQTRLLRVLQDGEYMPVGGRKSVKTDVRIVAATNRNLNKLIEQGKFREDLFYRLNVVPLRVPPLRDRVEDIPDLVGHFLRLADSDNTSLKVFDRDALERLKQHAWPGNVRELENFVRRLVALYADDVFSAAVVDLELADDRLLDPSIDRSPESNGSLDEAVDRHLTKLFGGAPDVLPAPGLLGRVVRDVEKPLISKCLAATKGNQLRASQILGLNRNTLRKKIRELDIEVVRGIE